MQLDPCHTVSSRAQRYRNRQVKREQSPPVPLTPDDTSDECKLPTPTDTSPHTGKTPTRPSRTSNRLTASQRSKRRDSSRSPNPPAQQSNSKKRKKDVKENSPLPAKEQKQLGQRSTQHMQQEPTHEEIPSEVAEWVYTFGKLSNSKQKLGLSKLVPRYV